MASVGTSPTYTTTEAVRAALGVDATDIRDSQILDAQLDVELALDLATWCPGAAAKLAPADPATPEQVTLQAALQSYCKWFCALEYARKPLAFLQLYGDGKAEQRRFTTFEWEALAEACAAKVAHFKSLIQTLDPDLAGTYSSTSAHRLMSGGVPVYDPVTNEGGE